MVVVAAYRFKCGGAPVVSLPMVYRNPTFAARGTEEGKGGGATAESPRFRGGNIVVENNNQLFLVPLEPLEPLEPLDTPKESEIDGCEEYMVPLSRNPEYKYSAASATPASSGVGDGGDANDVVYAIPLETAVGDGGGSVANALRLDVSGYVYGGEIPTHTVVALDAAGYVAGGDLGTRTGDGNNEAFRIPSSVNSLSVNYATPLSESGTMTRVRPQLLYHVSTGIRTIAVVANATYGDVDAEGALDIAKEDSTA